MINSLEYLIRLKRTRISEGQTSNVRKKKSGSGYEVLSGKTGKPLNKTFKSKKSAQDFIKAYHANVSERILRELRGDINEQGYKFQDARDSTVKPLRPLLKLIAKKAADEIEKMAKSGKFLKIQDDTGSVGNAELSLALGVEVLAALQDKI